MADSTDSGTGGLTGLLGKIDPQLLMSLGMGVMSAGRYGGNLGQGLMQGVQSYYQGKEAQQSLGMGRLQMQQLQQEMPLRMGYLQALQGQLGAGNGAPAAAPPQGLLGGTGAAPALPDAAAGPAAAGTPPMGAPQPAPAPMAPQTAQQGPSGGLPNDPMQLMRLGAFGGALGMPGGAQIQELAKTQLQYDPRLATKMEAAKSQIAQTQEMISQAMARGDTQTAWGLSQKLQQDMGLLHVATMSGTRTMITPQGITTVEPSQNTYTVQGQSGLRSAVIPGAVGAQEALAGGRARGEAQGETVEVTDAQGNKYIVPKSVIVGGAGVGAGGPQLAGLGPAQTEMFKGNAAAALETNKEYQGQAEAGQQMVAQTQQILDSARTFQPGQFAERRAAFLNMLNSAGLATPEEQKRLGSFQEGQKIAIQLQASATKMLGSREAAQIFDKMGKSMPNLTMSQNGIEKVGAWQMGIARYNMARAAAANERAQSNDATGVNQIRDQWIKNSNPLYFMLASASKDVRPEMLNAVKNPRQFIADWNKAANAGFAPRPDEYAQ